MLGHVKQKSVQAIFENMKFISETERLILREQTEDDAAAVLRLGSDPWVLRYLTGPAPTSLAYPNAASRSSASAISA